MDWGKTLSSEQTRAADLAFLSLVSRPAQVQAAEERLRSPGRTARGRPPGRTAGPGIRRRGLQARPRWRRGPGTAGRRRESALPEDPTGRARHADPHGLRASFRSANNLQRRAFGHTQKCMI
uniref:Uncharacterized protein n=1 Tax=Rhinolophus ferrumequinum TaxID=59479 RepID=A0A671EZV0_RHIFE